MLRFCAGEEGLAQVTPDATRARLRAELATPHPDLGVLRSDDRATIVLDPAALARVRTPRHEAAFARPESRPRAPERVPEPEPAPRPPAPPGAIAELQLDDAIRARGVPGGASCAFCGVSLPAGRGVHFCPHCGQNQTPFRCHRCEAAMEPEWAYCVDCGHAVGGR